MDISLNELRMKQVVNIYDGKSLGHICDAIFDDSYGKLLGFVVPGVKKFVNLFKASNEVFIPYQNICKIGIDIILVELIPNSAVPQPQTNNQNVNSCSKSISDSIKATNYNTQ